MSGEDETEGVRAAETLIAVLMNYLLIVREKAV